MLISSFSVFFAASSVVSSYGPTSATRDHQNRILESILPPDLRHLVHGNSSNAIHVNTKLELVAGQLILKQSYLTFYAQWTIQNASNFQQPSTVISELKSTWPRDTQWTHYADNFPLCPLIMQIILVLLCFPASFSSPFSWHTEFDFSVLFHCVERGGTDWIFNGFAFDGWRIAVWCNKHENAENAFLRARNHNETNLGNMKLSVKEFFASYSGCAVEN